MPSIVTHARVAALNADARFSFEFKLMLAAVLRRFHRFNEFLIPSIILKQLYIFSFIIFSLFKVLSSK